MSGRDRCKRIFSRIPHLFILFFIGCSSGSYTHGVSFNFDNRSQLVLGKTTIDETRQLLGQEKKIKVWKEGDNQIKIETLIYSHYDSELHSNIDQGDYLELRFSQGILCSVYNGSIWKKREDGDLTPSAEIEINISTREDVLELLGEPDSRKFTTFAVDEFEDAKEEWTWRSGSSFKTVEIVFDTDDKVAEVYMYDKRQRAFDVHFADLERGKIEESQFLTLWSPAKAFEGYLGIVKAERHGADPEVVEYTLGKNLQEDEEKFPVWSYLPSQELKRFKNTPEITKMVFGAKGVCYLKPPGNNWRIRYCGTTVKTEPIIMGLGPLQGAGWTLSEGILDSPAEGRPVSDATNVYTVTFENSIFKEAIKVNQDS
jgi:hypothetical protein